MSIMIGGYEASYQENRVFEDNMLWLSGLSAIKGLQILKAMDINITELEPYQTYTNPDIPFPGSPYIVAIGGSFSYGIKTTANGPAGSEAVVERTSIDTERTHYKQGYRPLYALIDGKYSYKFDGEDLFTFLPLAYPILEISIPAHCLKSVLKTNGRANVYPVYKG